MIHTTMHLAILERANMKQHKYKATLTSDQGKHTINLLCSSIERAKEMIMEAEGCPERAILEIVEITDGKPLQFDEE